MEFGTVVFEPDTSRGWNINIYRCHFLPDDERDPSLVTLGRLLLSRPGNLRTKGRYVEFPTGKSNIWVLNIHCKSRTIIPQWRHNRFNIRIHNVLPVSSLPSQYQIMPSSLSGLILEFACKPSPEQDFICNVTLTLNSHTVVTKILIFL